MSLTERTAEHTQVGFEGEQKGIVGRLGRIVGNLPVLMKLLNLIILYYEYK